MAINIDWTDILRCPNCSGTLRLDVYKPSTFGICHEGLLTCKTCSEWYPITNGIPRLFIPGPLRPDDSSFIARWSSRERLFPHVENDPFEKDKVQVQSTFGYKWTKQAFWGMEGESARVMEEWLLPRYGWNTHKAYENFMRSKNIMLDAGCGLGREALRMARANPCAKIIGLELSECVDEAARHAKMQGMNNILYIQADLTMPPIKKDSIDFIISEGVLHHTPDTRQAFQALVSVLALGGELAFYVYRKKAPLREYADDYIRNLIKNLPPEEAWKLMESLTDLGRTLSELNIEVRIPQDVELLGIKSGVYDIQRLIYYTMFKCYWNNRLSYDENVLVNFDWYYPCYAWRHTEEEIRQWLIDAGLELIHESIENSGITVRGKKCLQD